MKKLIVVLVLIVAGVFVLKKTSLMSYAGTLWGQVRKESKAAIPTKFELDRVRHEIGKMEGDISNMIRPIAEHMASINRLKKDIQTTRGQVAHQKETLLTMTKDLEKNPQFVVYGGEQYSAERVRNKLQREFESFKRVEANLKSQEKLLDAKETSLAATREQLAKLISKKREYEVRLSQLAADEEVLRVATLGTRVEIDDSRATEIEAALANIEQRHEVLRAEVELRTGPSAADFIPVQGRPKTYDVVEIRNYLLNPPAEETTAGAQR